MKKIIALAVVLIGFCSLSFANTLETVPAISGIWDNTTGYLQGITPTGANAITKITPIQINGGVGIGADYYGLTAPANGMIVEGVVGIGTSTPTAGTSLDLGSTTSSLLLPSGTTGQRPTAATGMFRYNSTTAFPELYFGAAWLDVFASPVPAASNTAPAVASGFCTSPSIPANNGTAAFTIGVGTSCAGSTGTVTMPAATTAWACDVQNVTHPATSTIGITGGSQTTVTMTNYVRTTGVAGNWTDSDVLRVKCTAY